MSMFYRSTRDDNVKVTASQAILKGLAADGGLFVPESIPSLDKSLEAPTLFPVSTFHIVIIEF